MATRPATSPGGVNGGGDAEPITWADRKKRRTAFTHAAFICDDSSIQPLLPQLILANEHCLTQRDLQTILAECPRNVYVKRGKSGWMSTENLKVLLGCLVELLRPYKDSHQIILFLDAAKCHINRAIAEYCARTGLFLIIVPARMTFLLQPADTHLFARYKRTLKKHYHEVANVSEATSKFGGHDRPLGLPRAPPVFLYRSFAANAA